MTTNGTAATWRTSLPVFAVTTMILSVTLAGCESGTSLLGGANQPATAVADAPVARAATTVAIAPVLGVPDVTSKQLVAQVSSGLDPKRFTVLTQTSQPADYTLRGYATAAKDPASKDKGAAKLSYFFDVMDKSGKKVNRIAGDEILTAAAGGKDIWTSITPQISQTVATKTVTAFTAFVPTDASANIASAGSAAPVKAAASPADVATATPARSTPTQTGSIDKQQGVVALVPSVTGAPGDGSQALSAALQKELSRNGIALSETASGAQAYRVEGKVTVGADKDGKQPIEISWNVKDPQGKKLGTVTQKNEIPQGSLNGAWGKTADAAAAAAAQGIIKLFPAKTTQ
ncbi:MAG: hypothetical protein ABL901_06455 [Hyphomicrobiaceae bacterium]